MRPLICSRYEGNAEDLGLTSCVGEVTFGTHTAHMLKIYVFGTFFIVLGTKEMRRIWA
jgi:hypothetical protein